MKKTSPKLKLKKVYVVRHAEFFGREFTRTGEGQLHHLVSLLRSLIRGKKSSIFVVTSPLERAVKTAEAITKAFGITPQVFKELESDEYYKGQMLADGIVSLAGESEVAIVVGHFTAPSGIANAFSKEFGQSVPEEEVRNGRGYFVDLVRKKVSKLG